MAYRRLDLNFFRKSPENVLQKRIGQGLVFCKLLSGQSATIFHFYKIDVSKPALANALDNFHF